MTYEKIASIVHSVTMRFPRSDGSYPESWGNIPYDAQKQAAFAVERLDKVPIHRTPEELHQLWCELNERQGWVYGEKWCPINKTHPCMIPYEQLSDAQKLKDEIWGTLVPLLLSYKDTV